MDSLTLAPPAALKLVEVYQLAHDIGQLHQDPLFLQWRDNLFCSQIVEQKVANIFQATSTRIFMEGLSDLLVFIDKRLAINPSKYPDFAAPLTEKLLVLKNILIQIQDLSDTQ